MGWCAEKLGGAEGAELRSESEAAGDGGRGSSDFLCHVRRRYPERKLRRRPCRRVRSRHMGTRSQRARRARQGRSEIHPARRRAARLLGAGADAPARHQESMAAYQARRRLFRPARGRRFSRHEKRSPAVARTAQESVAEGAAARQENRRRRDGGEKRNHNRRSLRSGIVPHADRPAERRRLAA